MGKLPAILSRLAALIIAGCAIGAHAQENTDSLDVTDGDNPTLRYGFYTGMDGVVQPGRFYFVDDGESLEITLANYGQSPVKLPVLSYDRESGLLTLGWDGLPVRRCELQRYEPDLFLGNCVEGEAVMPMSIRISNDFDADMKGRWLRPSATDVAILTRAIAILEQQEQRNPEDDQICDDDISSGRYSVFCALYAASLDETGVYRHHRPAVAAARFQLLMRYPGEYVHLLRDINNNPEIPDDAIIDALRSERDDFARELGIELESG